LEAEEPAETSNGLVYLAKALWRIRRDRRWLAAIVDVLARGDLWTQRMTAALALLDVDDASAVPPLFKAIDDPHALVRHHAARALLAIHGLPADANDPEHMTYRLMSDDPVRRESGKRSVLAAIAARPIAAHRREQA
jgi:HEAT repeat protein